MRNQRNPAATDPLIGWMTPLALRDVEPKPATLAPHQGRRPNSVALRWGSFVLVMLLAAWLRSARPAAVELADDQTWVLMLASELLAGEGDPLRGPVATTGSAHPPHIAYLLSLPLLVSLDPWHGWWLGTAFTAALGLVFVAISYRSVLVLFGPVAATIAGLAMAVQPAAIAFSRKIWPPSAGYPFAALALLALILLARSGRGRWLAVACTSATLATMLHPSNAYFLPIVAVVGLLRVGSVGLRWLVTSLVAPVVFVAPLAIRELRDGGAYLQGVIRAATGAGVARVDLASFEQIARLAAGDAYGSLTGTFVGVVSGFGLDLPSTLLVALATVGLVCLVWQARVALQSGSSWNALALLLPAVWVLWPGIVTLRHSRELEPHFLLGTIAVLPIAIGAVARQAAWRSRWATVIVAFVVVLIATGQVYGWHEHLIRALEVGPTTSFQMPAGYSVEAARRAAELADGRPVLVGNPNGMSSVFAYLARGRFLVRRFDHRHVWVIPEEGEHLYVVDVTSGSPPGPVEADQIRTSSGTLTYALFRSIDVPPTADSRRQVQPVNAVLADTARYLAGESPRQVQPGDDLVVQVQWQVERTPEGIPGELHEFAHLVNDAGERVGGEDFRGFPVGSWAAGDLVKSTFRIPVDPRLPPGRYWVDVGMYEPATLERVSIVTDWGEVTTAVRFGPVVIPPTDPLALPSRSSGTRIANVAELEGYDVRTDGERVRVRLVWRSLTTVNEAYTVFAHALTPEGELLGQSDQQPADGLWPTTAWLPGDLIEDVHELAIAPAERERARLVVGMYRLPAVERLPTFASDGRPLGDEIDLGPLR